MNKALQETNSAQQETNNAQQETNNAQQITNQDLRFKIEAQDGKIKALDNYIEEKIIPMYKVNVQTDLVKKISKLLGSKLSDEESASNDKKHSVNRLECFVSRLEEKDFRKSCSDLDHKYFTMLKKHYSSVRKIDFSKPLSER